MSQVQQLYDKFMTDLKNEVPKMDPKLTTAVIHMQDVLKNEYDKSPFVEFFLEYKPSTDMDKKITQLRTKRNLKATTTDEPNQIFAANRITLDELVTLAADSDIKNISGKVLPIVRS